MRINAADILQQQTSDEVSNLVNGISDPKLKDVLNKQLFYTKRQLNVQYPKEFEYYMVAFELVDEESNTKKYFIFPIMPSQLSERKAFNTNIKKTVGGIVVLDSPTFVPVDIILSGNFGRKLKVVIGDTHEDFMASFQIKQDNQELTTTKKSIYDGVVGVFDKRMKTGYGCIKILEDIILESKSLDDAGRPHRLIFYNLASGNSYYVKPVDFTISQGEQTNMIWNYSLQLKGVAPVSAFNEKVKTNEQLTTDSRIQKQVNNVTTRISGLIKNVGKRVPVLR